jgi:hypothetical protein
MIPQLIEDLLLLLQAVSHEAGWLLAAGCDLCCCGDRWISSGDHR